jgi:hypothetical protein
MADEKMSEVAPRGKIVFARGSEGSITEVKVGDGDEYQGMLCTGTGETFARGHAFLGTARGEVDLCGETETPLCILDRVPDLDIDAVITATRGADGVPAALIGAAAQTKAFLLANCGSLTSGQWLIPSATAGLCKGFAYTDGAEKTDAPSFLAGRILHNHTNDASNRKVCYMIMV